MAIMTPPPKRRCFRFGLRTMFKLMLISAAISLLAAQWPPIVMVPYQKDAHILVPAPNQKFWTVLAVEFWIAVGWGVFTAGRYFYSLRKPFLKAAD